MTSRVFLPFLGPKSAGHHPCAAQDHTQIRTAQLWFDATNDDVELTWNGAQLGNKGCEWRWEPGPEPARYRRQMLATVWRDKMKRRKRTGPWLATATWKVSSVHHRNDVDDDDDDSVTATETTRKEPPPRHRPPVKTAQSVNTIELCPNCMADNFSPCSEQVHQNFFRI